MRYIKKRLVGVFTGIADRLLSILGAVGMAQFPQFFGQYIQRLGGHLQEARRTVYQYQQAADKLDISLEEYIAQHFAADNPVFKSSGEVIAELLNRVQHLEQAFNSMQQSNPFTRWFVFLQDADWEIARQTLSHYTPGLPTNLEGIIYGLSGLLLGWGVYGLIRSGSCNLEKKIKSKRTKLDNDES